MNYTIVALDYNEKFIKFIDPDRCELKETHKVGGLRTLELEYRFENLIKDKELFKLGNKIWVAGDINITDCLYVVNTKVEEDIFKENSFTVELEEVLVELNNAPPVFQIELEAWDGFHNKTTTDPWVTKVDYNFLNYMFGDYFNMGVVQDCLNDISSWFSFKGSINRMTLLREIEESTGNIFVTRYEKDKLDNTIHRYLDFLNPINANKNWTLNLEYDFQNATSLTPVSPDLDWEVKRFIDNITPHSIPETVAPDDYDPETDDWYIVQDGEGTLDTQWTWNKKDETVVDENTVTDYTPIIDLDADNVVIRITDGENILNNQGEIYNPDDEEEKPLLWSAEDIGFTSETKNAVITLCMMKRDIGMTVNGKTFPVTTDVGGNIKGYVAYTITEEIPGYTESIANEITEDNTIANTVLPDDSFIEIYDNVNNKLLFQTCINRQIGHVHEETLDLNFNISNIEMKIDESKVYTAVAPLMNQRADGASDALIGGELNDLIRMWKALSVEKGSTIPMIIDRTYVVADTYQHAIEQLGPQGVPTNYWWPPYHPTFQNADNSQTEFKWDVWRASAYWSAPFTKKAGEMFISLDKPESIQYTNIAGRGDTRNEKGPTITPKMGMSSTTAQTQYAIYNEMALYLKEHRYPDIEVTVNVANLEDKKFNNYEIHDKVYIKIPDYEGLITAKVTETSKEPNNPSKNTVKLNNYSVTTIKTIPHKTIINCENTSFMYPDTKFLEMSLENMEYDSDDSYSVQYPSNKLISFSIYKVENNNAVWTGENYTRTTDSNGQAKILMDYDPGDYEIKVMFGGDEEYQESSTTVRVNVGGVKEQPVTTTEDGTVKSTTYWDKWGRSPDRSKIMAVGKISAPGDKGNYSQYWEGEFLNKCPYCKKSTLYWGIFYAGNEHGNWGWFEPLKKWAPGSVEGHIFCANCDMDFSVQGNEHRTGRLQHHLTQTKNVQLSNKARAYELKNGKMVYEAKIISQEQKTVTNSTNRKVIGNPDSYVTKTALNIVGNKTGQAAAQAIASWMDKNISYSYYFNFVYSATNCLQNKRANCCDGTRLYFELCDAAGCSEFYKMEYIHVSCNRGHVFGRLTAKSTGNTVYVDNASTHDAWNYVCVDYRNCSHNKRTTYPTRPF